MVPRVHNIVDMIDVCICTHAGASDTLERVLRALAEQTLNRTLFRVVIVDNANAPALRLKDKPFSILSEAGIEVSLIREERLGVAYARVAALRQTTAGAIVFVDDDNVLAADFLEKAQRVLDHWPNVGCFSGKIRLPQALEVPEWIRPLVGSFAIRELGEKPIVDWFRGDWKPWVPAATASMVLRRAVADTFLLTHATRNEFWGFGRKGQSMMSGEDFLIALSAAEAGYKCGYFPQLVMTHWIRQDRFTVSKMAKLMYCFGLTDLKRDVYLGAKPVPFERREFVDRLTTAGLRGKALRARFCLSAYEFVYVLGRAYKLLKSGQPVWKQKS